MNLTDNVFFFGYPDPMEYWPLVLLMFGTFISGILIGSIGVGGVAIVPMLVLIGVDGKVAVTSSMLAYIFVAVSAIIVHAKSTKLTAENIRQLTIMCVSSFPTALLAGYVLTLISANVAILICASVALLTSIKSIVEFAKKKCQQNSTPLQTSSEPSPVLEDGSTTRVGQSTEDEESHDSSPEMVNVSDDETENAKTATNATSDTTIDSVIFTYIGIITGFGSGLTGTSGPVVALPQIFLTRPQVAPFLAVAYAVVVQLPVAVGSTIGNFWFGQLDLGLGLLLGILLAASCPIGVGIASKLNGDVIKLVVSIVLIVAAAVLFGNTIPKMIAEDATNVGNGTVNELSAVTS